MDRGKYKNKLMTAQQNRISNQSVGKCHEDAQILFDIQKKNYKLAETIANKEMDHGIRWILGYSNYINNLDNKPLTTRQKFRLNKGHIVRIDLFGHFVNEFTYDHMAIVLKADAKGMLIAPLTSNPFKYQNINRNPNFIKLEANIPALGSLRKNSTILLEHVRYVDRHRILNIFNRVSDNNKLDEIEIALSNLLTPSIYKELNAIKTENAENKQKIIELEEENIKKEEELKELKEFIEKNNGKQTLENDENGLNI